MTLLILEQIKKHFMGVRALDGVNLSVDRDEIVGLVGPNGSGKTTLFNCIMGDLFLDNGSVTFEEQEITNWAPHRVVRLGITRSYQQVQVFSRLSVLENMMLAGQQRQGDPIFSAVIRARRVMQLDRAIEAEARERLEMLRMVPFADEYAGNLSYGQKKLLSIGMTMMSQPRLMLLDEPIAGVNPTLVRQLIKHIIHINQQGCTILIVEHNIPVIMELCQRVIVMNNGKVIADGDPSRIREDPVVLQAYFGK